MNEGIVFKDLGVIDYKKAWDYQEQLFEKLVNSKINSEGIEESNYLLFCEHPHVYTLGKSGTENNLLINDQFLKKINATYYRINRGGDITYHGPGQIVGYPIWDLEKFGLLLKDYIEKLEESIILTLKEYGIVGERVKNATGVWIETGDHSKVRKICAIGVRASRYVTMHGFALNVNTDLNYFNYINPCGFADKGVTSIEKELGRRIDFEEVKNRLKENIFTLFDHSLT